MKILTALFSAIFATAIASAAEPAPTALQPEGPAATCRAYREQRAFLPQDTFPQRSFLASADRFCTTPENSGRSPLEISSQTDGYLCPSSFYSCLASGFYYYAC